MVCPIYKQIKKSPWKSCYKEVNLNYLFTNEKQSMDYLLFKKKFFNEFTML